MNKTHTRDLYFIHTITCIKHTQTHTHKNTISTSVHNINKTHRHTHKNDLYYNSDNNTKCRLRKRELHANNTKCSNSNTIPPKILPQIHHPHFLYYIHNPYPILRYKSQVQAYSSDEKKILNGEQEVYSFVLIRYIQFPLFYKLTLPMRSLTYKTETASSKQKC